MLSVENLYKRPEKAEGYRKMFLTDYHTAAWDSGGFAYLMRRLKNPDPYKTIALYKAVGVKKDDLPMQLDTPPAYDLTKKERYADIYKSALYYHIMLQEIPNVLGVAHGWTLEELSLSLEWIEDPDRLAAATNIPLICRTKDKMTQMAAGTNFALTGGSQYILDHVTSDHSHVMAAPGGDVSTYVIDHLKNKEAKALAAGTNIPITSDKHGWVMGNLNPHSSVADRIAVGGYQQSGMFVCDHIANTPNRMKKKRIATGSMASAPMVIDTVVSSKPKSNPIAAGAYQQSGMYVLDYAGNLKKPKKKKAKGKGKPKKEKVKRAPPDVVLERLALVLNMLRDRELFILGGASPHYQHILFMGGAMYSDTSSWRLKAYMASIYLPEIGARAIGYKETDPRLKRHEIPILRSCLRHPTHPFSGMPVRDFLELGHMNVRGYYKTVKQRKWPAKPFDLRALHNAWVLKVLEEAIANEYANDPDRYYRYLLNRFEGHSILMKRLKKIWSMLKRPYVQDKMQTYLIDKK